MNTLFPIFIRADEIQILLIGGGEVAEEKLRFLLKSSPEAQVRIVARELNSGVRDLIRGKSNIRIAQRSFEPRDLNQVHLVIAATDDASFNQQLKGLCMKKNLLLNIADKSSLCDFYLGGIVTKGDLKIAISTNGKSPVLAKRLRQFFEAELPDSLDQTIKGLEKLRKKLKSSFRTKVTTLNKLTQDLIEHDN